MNIALFVKTKGEIIYRKYVSTSDGKQLSYA